MKELLIIAVIILFFGSCENDKLDLKSERDPEIIFGMGTTPGYKYSDIDLYDSSTHILYFKTNHPEFDEKTQSYFRFFVDTVNIYEGDIWPLTRSYYPTRAYISWPWFYQNYALRIELPEKTKPDMRNDSRIIKTLKDHNLLHSGLLITINSVDCGNSQINFSFTVANKDESSILILDPYKMGANLFHYFTNGLIFYKLPNLTATAITMPSQTPTPFNSWKNEWFSKINMGESKTYTIIYPITTPMISGEYKVTFTFPGLGHQVDKDQLIQPEGRIWLGDFKTTKSIVIN